MTGILRFGVALMLGISCGGETPFTKYGGPRRPANAEERQEAHDEERRAGLRCAENFYLYEGLDEVARSYTEILDRGTFRANSKDVAGAWFALEGIGYEWEQAAIKGCTSALTTTSFGEEAASQHEWDGWRVEERWWDYKRLESFCYAHVIERGLYEVARLAGITNVTPRNIAKTIGTESDQVERHQASTAGCLAGIERALADPEYVFEPGWPEPTND